MKVSKTYNFFDLISYLIIVSIFILSIIKVPEIKQTPSFADKIVHFVMYFICAWAFKTSGVKRYVYVSICYGVIIEIIQYFLPWRSFSLSDIIANTLGAFIFFLFFRNFIERSH